MEPITTDVKLRRLVVNMIYVGVLGRAARHRAGRGRDARSTAQLGRKPKALALNHAAVRAGMAVRARELAEARPVPRRAHERRPRARS